MIMNREYTKQVGPWEFEEGCVFTAKDFLHEVEQGFIGNFDGSGYWAKITGEDTEGFPVLFMNREDEVFSSVQEDATHVIWYNK